MEEQDKPQSIILQVQEYLETYVKLTKLKAIDKGTSVVASIVIDVVVFLALLIVLLFASITLGFFLADVFHSYWEGFGCVTALYLLIIVCLLVFRKSIQRPIINALIKKLF